MKIHPPVRTSRSIARLCTALLPGLLMHPAAAHDPGETMPVHITASGWVLTGEAARMEQAEWQNRLPAATPAADAASSVFVTGGGEKAPAQAAAFAVFSPAVKTRSDQEFLYIESQGLPAHNMMVGITAWQQQVPLPQDYSGANAWRIPLHPVPAKEPASIKGRFLRGAVAVAANGIPIFNPQNNRGEISYEIGELDQWGGHCGRADDYHYHIAPLHLQKTLGRDKPVAYALDGYPVYGLTEPDGSAPHALDECHGHTSAALGYHYHAAEKYPYVIGAFHGTVTEREGQVDPQPRAHAVRPALQALRGAKITHYTGAADGKSGKLVYETGGRPAEVNFVAAEGSAWKFTFVAADGTRREETYPFRQDGRGSRDGERPPREGGERPRPGAPPREAGTATAAAMDALKKPVAGFVLSSPVCRTRRSIPWNSPATAPGTVLRLPGRARPQARGALPSSWTISRRITQSRPPG